MVVRWELTTIIIRVIAIDLPGYGKTGGGLDGQKRGEYLGSVISSLSPDSRPVLVSPSMSGSFVVPMLKQVGGRMVFNKYIDC